MEMDGKDRKKGPRVLYPGSGAGWKTVLGVYERCMKLLSVTTKHARSPSRATWAARLQARGPWQTQEGLTLPAVRSRIIDDHQHDRDSQRRVSVFLNTRFMLPSSVVIIRYLYADERRRAYDDSGFMTVWTSLNLVVTAFPVW